MDVRAVDFKEAIRLIAEASGFHDSSTPAAHKKAVATVKIGNKEFVKETIHETEYIYTDETGNPVHKIVRTDGTLTKTGERNNICFLCVNHDCKGQQTTAANRALGATGLMGKMRIGYTAKKELKTSEENEYPGDSSQGTGQECRLF